MMFDFRRICLSGVALGAMLLTTAASAGTLVGATVDAAGVAQLLRINPAGGEILSATTLHYGGTDDAFKGAFEGLSTGPGGHLYGVLENSLGMAVLARIDPASGAVIATDPLTYAGTSDIFTGNITGLTASGNLLYGVLENTLGMAILARIDPVAATVTATDPLTYAGTSDIFLGSITGLAGSASLLYGVAENALGMAILTQIDPLTASVTATDPLTYAGTSDIFTGSLLGLSLGADGLLYGTLENALGMGVLARIDPATNEVLITDPVTLPGGQDIYYGRIAGLEYLPDIAPPAGAVPEPAAWALLIAGFGLAGGSLRRQRARLAISSSSASRASGFSA